MRDVRWEAGYWWFVLRQKWACFNRDLSFRLAMRLPRRVALGAFIRVYGVRGDCGPDFDWICKEWERRS